MLKSRFFLLSAVVIVVFAVILFIVYKQEKPPFLCIDAIGCVAIAPGQPIEIGALQALSGGTLYFGIDHFRGVELAVARQGHKILGHPIRLQKVDSRCTSEGGANAALKIVANPQSLAILGTSCSGSAVTASKIMSEAGLVMISGGNSGPSLTSVSGKQGTDWHPGYFRSRPNGVEQGRAAAVFAFQELGINKAATINDGDAFTTAISEIFKQEFVKLGGEIVLSGTVNKGDANMKPVLTSVANSGAGVIYFPLFTSESIPIVRQARKVPGLENIVLIGTDAALSEVFLKGIGTEGAGIYITAPSPPKGPIHDKLLSEYESAYNEPPIGQNYTYSFDAAGILFNAIKAVAAQEQDGTLYIGRQALRDALYAISQFKGVTGYLSCDKFGDCAVAKYDIMQFSDPGAGLKGLKANVVYVYTGKESE
ncbi:MAG: ABC transporter substrate-binding protein [Desulfobacterales bacterium]|nr:ABC transporter substrate-binding protein [Desulfobacterales bacterium]